MKFKMKFSIGKQHSVLPILIMLKENSIVLEVRKTLPFTKKVLMYGKEKLKQLKNKIEE
jgi:hypothetical protein